jgi:Uncharacterized protein conserved in bacteria (DUF2252)
MRKFADLNTLDLWYLHTSSAQVVAVARSLEAEFRVRAPKMSTARLEKIFARARARGNLAALTKLCENDGRTLRLASHPPLLVPFREFGSKHDADRAAEGLQLAFDSYRRSVRDDLRELLDQFEIVDMGRKVVGVGSVGTRCFVVLLRGKGPDDVLFLQVKQAEASVLEPYLGTSAFTNHGHRVVTGQRLLEAVPDIFLGWSTAPDGYDYYFRRLWDMKGGIDPNRLTPGGLCVYGALCGSTLARAHGRGGDETAIAAYLGRADAFDQAVADFALTYADVNDADHKRLASAVRSGRVQAMDDTG